MESLIAIDRTLFMKINKDWTNGFFDWLFPSITDLHQNPFTLLVVLPLLILWYRKQKFLAIKWILVAGLSIGLSDAIAYRAVKPLVQRNRPEHSGVEFTLRTHPHNGLSFPSNHATNMFAAATVLSGGLPWLSPVFFLFAFLVAYSRVYVGVHFPIDVMTGAMLGILVAWSLRWALGRWLKPPPQELTSSLGDAIVRSAEGSSRGRN